MKKVLIIFLGIFGLAACLADAPTQLLGGSCNGVEGGYKIMDVDEETEMCLVVSSDMPVQSWQWSNDGSILAFALHDPTITRPAGTGKFAGRPLTIHWYFMERNGRSATELTVAYNRGLSLSPDGKFIVVSFLCSADTTACHEIYETNSQQRVCSYRTNTVWFSDSDCTDLTLKNGGIWDIEYEVNKSGCEYFHSNGWDAPNCNGSEPNVLTPVPTVTPIPIEGYP